VKDHREPANHQKWGIGMEDYFRDPERFWKSELNIMAWCGGVYNDVVAFKQRTQEWEATSPSGVGKGLAHFLPCLVVGPAFRHAFDPVTCDPWSEKALASVKEFTSATGLWECWRYFPGGVW
jgi:hypothetical protein